MTVVLLVPDGGREGVRAGVDVAALAADAARQRGVPLEVSDLEALAGRLSGGERPRHVVVDRRGVDGERRDAVRALLTWMAQLDVPVSVFYDVLDPADIADVFTLTALDQALEVRSSSDVEHALAEILDHVVAAASEPQEGDRPIGRTFTVGPDYATARTRSLVSQRMGGFVTELRTAVVRLKRQPLAATPPWDPGEQQAPDLLARSKDGWSLHLRAGQVPNLSQVLTAHRSEPARQLLAGETLPQEWLDRWGTPPPAVLITGESGTGKTLVARTIADLLMAHQTARVRGRFVKVDCGSLAAESVAHTLMGAGPGVWTGIEEAAPGLLARAAHGVVFFDEIGDLDPDVQRSLLTFLDDRLVRPSGALPFPGFLHVVAATNRDVEEGASQRWFRNDLLARFPLRLHMPPLRERGVDEIAQLVDFAAQDPEANPVRGDAAAVRAIAADAFEELLAREYRNGNFRELEETVHAALQSAVRRRSSVLERGDVPPSAALRARADRDSARVRVAAVDLPASTVVVEVATERDLRHLAERERRTLLTDDSGVSWVLTTSAAFRAPADPSGDD